MTIEATGSRLTAALTRHLAPRGAAEGVGWHCAGWRSKGSKP